MRYIKHILGCCLWLPVVVHAGSCEDWVAKAVSIQGTVEVRRAATPSSQWLVIHRDDTFCASDRVRVGPNSRAALLLSNDTILRLDQKTTLNFGQIAADKPSSMSLISGIVHFISRIRQTFTVDTPYVNAGIEGTEFVVAVLKDLARVTVFEGQVKAYNAQGETILTSGQSAVTQRGQAPLLKLLAQPRDAVQWALYYPMIVSADIVSMHSAAEAYRGSIEASLQSYRQGRLAAALQHLSNLPDKLDDAALAVYRAALRLNVGQVSAAQADLARAEQLDPQSAEVAATQSIIAVVQNDRDGALRLAQTAVKRDPDNASAHLALSYALQARFDIEGAVATMKKAVARQPGNALARARLAELYLMTGELDKALNNAQAATAIDPQLARTQSVLGFAYLTQIEVEKAQEAFKAAIERDQSDPLARLGLGLAMIRRGELKAGRREFEFAASLDPNHSLIRSYLGKAYFEEKRDKVAASQYDLAKQLDPNDPTPWFYDALRKQSVNRPIEAMQDLNRSIELNDNRAVYRSKLLLDQDVGDRSASLARIYDDLDFDRLAQNEAYKSIDADPTNYSSHRFLSQAYSALPRHEIARASELLQSQLLAPLNNNPVRPSVAETNLNHLKNAGPTDATFNEFNPLFVRNLHRLDVAAVAGNKDTYGDEVVYSGLKNRHSLSVGQYHYQTDGFRDNNDFDQNIYNLFYQVAFSHKSSFQIELKRNKIDNGDLSLRFDPDNFSENLDENRDTDSIRLGYHWEPSPNTDFIASLVYQDTDFERNNNEQLSPSGPDGPVVGTDSRAEDSDGYTVEAQYLGDNKYVRYLVGIGRTNSNFSQNNVFQVTSGSIILAGGPSQKDFEPDHKNIYAYSHFSPIPSMSFTVGISGDDFDLENIDESQVNPKFGLNWDMTSTLRFRLAAFRTLKRSLISNQTIEPTQIAGFNQFFDDFSATDAKRYGVGVDYNSRHKLYGGIEATKRDLSIPISSNNTLIHENEDEYLHRAYVYKALTKTTALSLEYNYEKFRRKESSLNQPEKLTTQRLPLALNYHNSNGLFASITPSYLKQDIKHQVSADVVNENDDVWLIDAQAGYRLPKRLGVVSLNGYNLFNANFRHEDVDWFNNLNKQPRVQPERLLILKIALSFY